MVTKSTRAPSQHRRPTSGIASHCVGVDHARSPSDESASSSAIWTTSRKRRSCTRCSLPDRRGVESAIVAESVPFDENRSPALRCFWTGRCLPRRRLPLLPCAGSLGLRAGRQELAQPDAGLGGQAGIVGLIRQRLPRLTSLRGVAGRRLCAADLGQQQRPLVRRRRSAARRARIRLPLRHTFRAGSRRRRGARGPVSHTVRRRSCPTSSFSVVTAPW